MVIEKDIYIHCLYIHASFLDGDFGWVFVALSFLAHSDILVQMFIAEMKTHC